MNKKIILCTLLIITSASPNIFKMFHSWMTDNFHAIEEGQAYRSSTLSAKTLARKIVKYGIKTVINLRGAEPHKQWWQKENEVLKKHGIAFHNIAMDAKVMPGKEQLIKILDIFESGQRPLLVHCQAGADRTGTIAAFYLITQRNTPKKIALAQLSDSLGHWASRYPAQKFFIKILPDDGKMVRTWLNNAYHPERFPQYNMRLSRAQRTRP